jgi:hypothetical protein
MQPTTNNSEPGGTYIIAVMKSKILSRKLEVPVERPAAMQICQWGSKTGKAASQPAVAFWVPPLSPHP